MKYNRLLTKIHHEELANKHLFETYTENLYLIFHYKMFYSTARYNRFAVFSLHYIFTPNSTYHIYYNIGKNRTNKPKIYLGEYSVGYPLYLLDEMFDELLRGINPDTTFVDFLKATKRTYYNNSRNLKQTIYIHKTFENPREISNEQFR